MSKFFRTNSGVSKILLLLLSVFRFLKFKLCVVDVSKLPPGFYRVNQKNPPKYVVMKKEGEKFKRFKVKSAEPIPYNPFLLDRDYTGKGHVYYASDADFEQQT